MANNAYTLRLQRTLFENFYRAIVIDESGNTIGRLSIVPNIPLGRSQVPENAPHVTANLIVIVDDADINKDNLIDFEERVSYSILKRFSTEEIAFQECLFYYPSPKYVGDCGEEEFPGAGFKITRTLYNNFYGVFFLNQEGQPVGDVKVVPIIPADRSMVPEDAPDVEPYLLGLVNNIDGINKANIISFENDANTALVNRFSNPTAQFSHCELYYPSPAFVFELPDAVIGSNDQPQDDIIEF